MTNVSDCKKTSLETLTGLTGNVNDLEKVYLTDLGATASDVNLQWRQVFQLNGATSDNWSLAANQFLIALGAPGVDVTDNWKWFWCVNEGAVSFGDDFVMVFATTAPAETVTIPCRDVGIFNAVLDHGDSTTSDITTFNDGDLAHEYADADDHTARISGPFTNVFFNNGGDALKLKEILNWGNTGFEALNAAYFGCANLIKASGTANFSLVTLANDAFRNCTSLAALPGIADWDMSSVTSCVRMFRNCTLCTGLGGIANWDIGQVTDATDFMRDSNNALSTAEYDAILIAWRALPSVQNGVAWHFGDAVFTSGGAAEAARTSLVDDDNWVFTDGGGT